MDNDIRVKGTGGTPAKLNTTDRIKMFGWADFEQVDNAEELAEYWMLKRQFKKEKSSGS